MKTLKLLFPIFILCLTSISSAQKFESFQLYPLEKQFNLGVQFSGTTISNDTLFVISEGCKNILLFDLKNLDTKTLNTSKNTINLTNENSYELEALAKYKEYIVYSDEGSNTLKAISLKDSYNPINIQYDLNFPKRKTEDNGLEGMEIDEKNNLIFITQEITNEHRDSSRIWSFSITMKNKVISLSKIDSVTLFNKRRRFPGLTIDNSNNIFLLKTHTSRGNSIDRISYSKTGLFNSGIIESADIKHIIDTLNTNDFSSNLEGISWTRDGFWIASDNMQEDDYTCNQRAIATSILFVKHDNLKYSDK